MTFQKYTAGSKRWTTILSFDTFDKVFELIFKMYCYRICHDIHDLHKTCYRVQKFKTENKPSDTCIIKVCILNINIIVFYDLGLHCK